MRYESYASGFRNQKRVNRIRSRVEVIVFKLSCLRSGGIKGMRLGMHAAAEVACNGVGVAEEHARSFRLKVQGSGFRVGIPKHITRAPKREHQSAPILFTGIPKHITRAPKREHQSAQAW